MGGVEWGGEWGGCGGEWGEEKATKRARVQKGDQTKKVITKATNQKRV